MCQHHGVNYFNMNVSINKIKPNPKNPRTIKDERFEKLKKSIQDFPDMLNKRPLVCFTDTDGKFVVLGGNMRLKAAKDLGLKELPIILANEWTEEQKAEFLIKDNVGFGEWDWNELNTDWNTEQLEGWGLEVPKFAEPVDYSDKNEEIDIDALDTEMIIKLKYTEDEYQLVREQLSKIAATPEQAVWKLLGNE
jgi:ParB-like chromosome segregation protein Spo0J